MREFFGISFKSMFLVLYMIVFACMRSICVPGLESSPSPNSGDPDRQSKRNADIAALLNATNFGLAAYIFLRIKSNVYTLKRVVLPNYRIDFFTSTKRTATTATERYEVFCTTSWASASIGGFPPLL